MLVLVANVVVLTAFVVVEVDVDANADVVADLVTIAPTTFIVAHVLLCLSLLLLSYY